MPLPNAGSDHLPIILKQEDWIGAVAISFHVNVVGVAGFKEKSQ